jgi:drug/metabolite transporter (DMT)-like permease
MYAGMVRLTAGRIAVFQFVYPAVAIVIDWLYFDERLGGAQLFGVAVMSMAILYAERDAAGSLFQRDRRN